MESQALKIRSEQNDSVNHTEDPHTVAAEHVNLPVKTERMEDPAHSTAGPASLVTDTFTEVNRLSGTKNMEEEIVVKQEPLEWMGGETSCGQNVDSMVGRDNLCPANDGTNGPGDWACESSSNSRLQDVCSRGALRVRLKDVSLPNVQIKTEPLDLSSDSLFQVPNMTIKTEPLDLSSDSLFQNPAQAAADLGRGDKVNITGSVDDGIDENSAAGDPILDSTDDSINSCDDHSDDDDNEMEVLPIYFQSSDLHADRGFQSVEGKDHSKESAKCALSKTREQAVSRSLQNNCKSRPQVVSSEHRASVKDKKSGTKRIWRIKNQPCKCSQCGREFANPKYLRSHMRVHSDVKPFTCDECPSAFVRPSDLRRHKKTHSGEKEFKCQLCESAFADSCKLKIHMRIHTGERPYKCEICEEAFSQPSQYARHKRVHKGERPFQCHYCPSTFTMTSDYRRHLRIHTGERPFICEYCPASFPEAKNLRVHVRTHTGEKPFKCKVCDASFAQAANLSRHLKTHTGERPAKCELCPSAFADKHKLRVHMRSHSGEKPYRCLMCPAAFATSSSLNRHNVMHSGEKPFKCEDCPAVFALMSKLRVHAVCHSFNGPFQCQRCTASFRNAYGLTVHSHVHE